MLTLSLESNDREPGTICNSLIYRRKVRNNRSHPTTGNDSTRERFMPTPALDLIVPTRSIVPSREAGSRERLTPSAPGEMGPSWPYSNTGGASAALCHRQAAKPGYHPIRLPALVTTLAATRSQATGANRKPCEPCLGFAR